MGRKEVLKVVSRELMDRRGVLDRFLREIRNAAQLHHPNIVTAYSAFRAGESIVFAMEYVEGHDSRASSRANGPLAVATRATSSTRSRGGSSAHAKGHGASRHQAEQPDFGAHGNRPWSRSSISDWPRRLARGPSTTSLTHEGQMLGTPDYIAPEQSLDAQKADIRADIYSLGCTLYYLLTGRPPFRGPACTRSCRPTTRWRPRR